MEKRTAFQSKECPYCPKAYVYVAALVKHIKTHTYDEVQPADLLDVLNSYLLPGQVPAKQSEPLADLRNSLHTAKNGADVVREVARRLRNANQTNRERLARDLEGIAFGLDFLYRDIDEVDLRVTQEKARKWDKLIELLPSIHDIVEFKEAQDVRTHDNRNGN